jgi:hypothetical protein
MMVVLVVVAVFALLGIAAQRWGVDSRFSGSDLAR